MKQYKHDIVNLSYLAAPAVRNERHLRAPRMPYLEVHQYLIKQAGMSSDGDLVNPQAALVGMYTKWRGLVENPPAQYRSRKRKSKITSPHTSYNANSRMSTGKAS